MQKWAAQNVGDGSRQLAWHTPRDRRKRHMGAVLLPCWGIVGFCPTIKVPQVTHYCKVLSSQNAEAALPMPPNMQHPN